MPKKTAPPQNRPATKTGIPSPTAQNAELQIRDSAEFIRSAGDATAAVTVSIIRFFTVIVERLGWPGLAIFLIFYCIQIWATDAQRQEIIDTYILGKGIQPWWPFIVVALFFVLLIWGQQLIHRRELRAKNDEIKRIGAEKSKTQEIEADREWKHVDELGGEQ